MRHRFGCCWDVLRLDTLIPVKLNPPQPAVSGDILILLPDRLVQVVYLNLARLMREGFPRHFDSPIGIERIEQSNG